LRARRRPSRDSGGIPPGLVPSHFERLTCRATPLPPTTAFSTTSLPSLWASGGSSSRPFRTIMCVRSPKQVAGERIPSPGRSLSSKTRGSSVTYPRPTATSIPISSFGWSRCASGRCGTQPITSKVTTPSSNGSVRESVWPARGALVLIVILTDWRHQWGTVQGALSFGGHQSHLTAALANAAT
jgi:hypothetical protein